MANGNQPTKWTQEMTKPLKFWLVLSIPHRGEPTTWWADNEPDFCDTVMESYADSGFVVWEQTTAAEMAANFGVSPAHSMEEFRVEGAVRIFDLAQQYGWDTPLYRADKYNNDDGAIYQPDEISLLDACIAAAAHDVSGFYLCRNPDEYHDVYAELTGPNAPRVGQCGPRVAAAALKKEAISLEWIADQESDFDDDSDDDDGVYFDDDE